MYIDPEKMDPPFYEILCKLSFELAPGCSYGSKTFVPVVGVLLMNWVLGASWGWLFCYDEEVEDWLSSEGYCAGKKDGAYALKLKLPAFWLTGTVYG